MAIRVGETIVTEFKSDYRDLERGFDKAEKRGKEFAAKMSRTLNATPILGTFGRGAAFLEGITAGIKNLPGLGMLASGLSSVAGAMKDGIKFGFDYNRTLEENAISFSVMLKSGDKAKTLLTDLARIAEKSPFEFPEVIQTTKQMLAMGYTVDEIKQRFLGLSDAASGLGVPMEQISRALGQIRQRGKVSFEEISQLLDANVDFWGILGDQLAKTDKQFEKLTSDERTKKLQELVTANKLNARGVEQALQIGFKERYGGLGTRVATETASGLEANLNDVAARLAGTASGPFFERYKNLLRGTLDVANSETTAALARGAASGSNTVFSALDEALKQGGNIGAGLIQGVGGKGFEAAKQFIGEFADGIGSHSPATEFIPLGAYSAQGWKIGFAAEMSKNGGYMGLFQTRGGRAPLSPGVTRYDSLIERIAREVGVDPNLIRAVMQQESGGRGVTSSAGAQGPMQLMPGTARRFGVTNPFDPAQAITGGAKYLRFLSDRYGGDINKVLAGYNAGEGNVDKYGGVPPFKETQNYVRVVKSIYERINKTADDFDAAVRDLAASTNWRLRGDKEPNAGRVRIQDLSEGEQFNALMSRPDFRAAYQQYYGGGGGGDLTGGTGRFNDLPTMLVEATQKAQGLNQAISTVDDGMIGLSSVMNQQTAPFLSIATQEAAKLNDEIQQTVPILQKVNEEASFLGITGKDASTAFQQAWISAFTRTDQDFKGMAAGFVLTFADMLNQMVQQWAAARIAKGIGDFVGSLFGGLGGGSGSTGGLGSAAASAIGGFAAGTMTAPPGLAWVGEKGPELVRFRGGERVYNNRESSRMAAQPTVNNYTTIINYTPKYTPNSYQTRKSAREGFESVLAMVR